MKRLWLKNSEKVYVLVGFLDGCRLGNEIDEGTSTHQLTPLSSIRDKF